MSLDNQITLRGFVTAEPKFRQTAQTATPVAEIRVGSTPRRLNRETGEWQDAPTSYYTVKCWRRLAINAASSLKKGDMVVIRGRFYMHSWVDNQQRPRSVLEIEADSLGHDLAYGWSHFLRGYPAADRARGRRQRGRAGPAGRRRRPARTATATSTRPTVTGGAAVRSRYGAVRDPSGARRAPHGYGRVTGR